jgi:hypothetical protein
MTGDRGLSCGRRPWQVREQDFNAALTLVGIVAAAGTSRSRSPIEAGADGVGSCFQPGLDHT